jgi:hypothetical protein
MAPALMVCWIEGGAVLFLFSVLPGGAVELPGRSRPAPGVVDLRWGGFSLSLTRSDLRRAERHLHAGGDSILAEMMELGRLGRGGQRQVRGLADRPPGVAHGGGDISLSLTRSDLRRAERSETRRLLGNRSHDLSAKSNSKRTSTRRQLDCTRTL